MNYAFNTLMHFFIYHIQNGLHGIAPTHMSIILLVVSHRRYIYLLNKCDVEIMAYHPALRHIWIFYIHVACRYNMQILFYQDFLWAWYIVKIDECTTELQIAWSPRNLRLKFDNINLNEQYYFDSFREHVISHCIASHRRGHKLWNQCNL